MKTPTSDGLHRAMRSRSATRLFTCALAMVALPLLASTAFAQSGFTLNGAECMDDRFPGTLGCTANDVRISGIADVSTNNGNDTCMPGTPDGVVDECDVTFRPVCDTGADNVGADCSGNANVCQLGGQNAPQLCGNFCRFPGDDVEFSATFIFDLSAQERYDVGGYFSSDGDPNGDGALTGTCSVTILPETGTFDRPGGGTGSFVDLDTTCTGKNCPQPNDTCGDINAAQDPIFYDISTGQAGNNFIRATCVDPDGNGQLNLPTCTSWRQSGANELCTSPTDAFPGAPSKCNCDPTFELPIDVPAAELGVVKTANPTSVNEPGGSVTFSVELTNTGIDPNNDVTVDTIDDSVYGDIADASNPAITSTTCSVPQVITPGGTYTCSFVADVTGNGGETHTDVVTGSGTDDNGNNVEGDDDADVDIVDVLPAISVTKTANPTAVQEGAGETVTFTVRVDNDSTADALELTSLSDDIHGDATAASNSTCSLPQTIAIGGFYECTFDAIVDGPAFSSETDTVTATGNDDEGNVVMDTDTATVNINDDVAAIQIVKTANPTSVSEPGGNVLFSFTITNLSTVDSITIDSLSDTIYGDISGLGDCGSLIGVVLTPGGSDSCSFEALVSGNAGDSETNVVTVNGTDDDGQPVMDSDDATVNVTNVPPAASLTKDASMVVATFDVAVTNDSIAESLDLTSLSDDVFGDITIADGVTILSTTCAVPQTIASGATYNCSFDAKISTSPHTNTLTGTVEDDDGGSVTPSDSASVTFE